MLVKLKVSGPLPKTTLRDRVHGITCRGTIYGVHRDIFNNGGCKTTLLFFADPRMCREYMKVITTRSVEKVLIGESEPAIAPIRCDRLPLQLESSPLSVVQKLCYLQYFDLFLVYNLMYGPGDRVYLDTYEMNSYVGPGRDLVNHYFNTLMTL